MDDNLDAEVPFHNLCALLHNQGRFDEVDALCKMFEEKTQGRMQNELVVARFYVNWAQALERQDKFDEAVAKLRIALNLQEKVMAL